MRDSPYDLTAIVGTRASDGQRAHKDCGPALNSGRTSFFASRFFFKSYVCSCVVRKCAFNVSAPCETSLYGPSAAVWTGLAARSASGCQGGANGDGVKGMERKHKNA